MTKTQQVKQFFNEGCFKKALRIAKTFRIGVTKEQSTDMGMAYECMVYPDTYKQLGIDTDEKIRAGVAALKTLVEAM